jgi:hypothetical protein
MKILFMSGYSVNMITSQGVLDESVNFIGKPFSMNDLGVKMTEVLSGIRKARASTRHLATTGKDGDL